MKTYKMREGIVLITICDEYMLVATREAREVCPYVQQINSVAAYYWKLLESGVKMKDMVSQVAEYFDMPKIKALITLDGFIKKLIDAGYLISEDVEEPK